MVTLETINMLRRWKLLQVRDPRTLSGPAIDSGHKNRTVQEPFGRSLDSFSDFDPILNQLAAEANLDSNSDGLIAPSGAGAGNEIMGVKEGQTSSLNFDNGLLAEKTERPPAPIPKTKLTAKNRSEFADLISQYADYTNMVSLVLRL